MKPRPQVRSTNTRKFMIRTAKERKKKRKDSDWYWGREGAKKFMRRNSRVENCEAAEKVRKMENKCCHSKLLAVMCTDVLN